MKTSKLTLLPNNILVRGKNRLLFLFIKGLVTSFPLLGLPRRGNLRTKPLTICKTATVTKAVMIISSVTKQQRKRHFRNTNRLYLQKIILFRFFTVNDGQSSPYILEIFFVKIHKFLFQVNRRDEYPRNKQKPNGFQSSSKLHPSI